MLKNNIIHIIFKLCVLQMYIIVLLPNIKSTYDQIDLMGK